MGGVGAPPASRGLALRSAAMDKQAVRQTLEQLAAFLELKGENPFRIRAFENAARAIAGYPGDVAEAARSGALADVKGIGKGTLELVRELVTTGRSSALDELREQVPPPPPTSLHIPSPAIPTIRH